MADPPLGRREFHAPTHAVDAICDAFEAAWLNDQHPTIEGFLKRVDAAHHDELLRELLLSEWDLRRRQGQPPEVGHYLNRFSASNLLITQLWCKWNDGVNREERDVEIDPEIVRGVRPLPTPADAGTLANQMDTLRSQWHRTNSPLLTLDGQTSVSLASGRYKVQSVLGEGGQKRVFLAHDNVLGRDVVIGILNGRLIDPDSLCRLHTEAQAMARLDEHPNVATVFDIGQEDGHPFIVTQYVRGGSVAALLSTRRPQPLELSDALRIGAETCRALNHAHSHWILHRDVKPTNVWLMPDGTVKLGDFGLALSLDSSQLTEGTMRLGTAAYIAPEQAVGAPLTPQADLYSLGVMLYEMIAGRRPFQGDTDLAVISQHINSRPVAPSWHNPAVNAELDKLVLDLLAKSPSNRPASAAVVADALETILVRTRASTKETVPERPATSLDRLAGGNFVGRVHEMDQLRAGLEAVIDGGGRVFFISGEPGSGKTRLTEELTTYARIRNAETLVGRCFEGEGAPAFWPWVQILRQYAQDRSPSELSEVMGAGAADIALLDLQIAHRLPVLPFPPKLEPEQALFRLFDSIATFLQRAASTHPLMLILDDLQWADSLSLRLLQFVSQQIQEGHLLIVGAYRDAPLGRGNPLTRSVAEIVRNDRGQEMRLAGLSREDVGRHMELTCGIHPPEQLVQRIWHKTEGNPFFVNEMIRLLVAEAGVTSLAEMASITINIPPRVRDVIKRRLELLSDRCNQTLVMAAVYGREFPLSILEALQPPDGDEVLDDLDEAADARVIAAAPGENLMYMFAHDLVRETIYDEVRPARRMRLHARIAGALERLGQGSQDPRNVAEVARHYVAAGPAADPQKAIEYSTRAGHLSFQQLAYDDAARHFETALQLLEAQSPVDQRQLCELLQDLGESQSRAGQSASSMQTFQRAFNIARDMGTSEHLVRAALALEWLSWSIGKPNVDNVHLCQEALSTLAADQSVSRARLLAACGRALQGLGYADQAASYSRDAIELARSVADSSTLWYVLELENPRVASGPGFIGQRLSFAEELLESARATGDLEKMFLSIGRRIYALLEIGDLENCGRSMEEFEAIAHQLRQPQYSYIATGYRTMLALLDGRFADAEQLAIGNLALGQRLQFESAEGIFGMQMFISRREQGRLQEVAPLVEMFVQEHSVTIWRPGLSLMYAELGQTDKARALFEELAIHDFSDIPHDGLAAASIIFLAEVCVSLADRKRADVLYRLLAPYAGYAVVASEWACFGAASRFLGQLAVIMHQWQTAETHFEQALAMNARMGARSALARTQHQFAQMLIERSAPGDVERATTLLGDAWTMTRQLGMQSLEIQLAAARRRQ